MYPAVHFKWRRGIKIDAQVASVVDLGNNHVAVRPLMAAEVDGGACLSRCGIDKQQGATAVMSGDDMCVKFTVVEMADARSYVSIR